MTTPNRSPRSNNGWSPKPDNQPTVDQADAWHILHMLVGEQHLLSPRQQEQVMSCIGMGASGLSPARCDAIRQLANDVQELKALGGECE